MEILIKKGLDSSRLKSATYFRDATHPLEYILTVTFVDGAIYSYYGVPRDVAEGLFTAQSPGGYLHQYVKSAYNYAKVDEEPGDEAVEPVKAVDDRMGKLIGIAHAIEDLKARVEALPQSRAKALVLTKLDEAQLWLTRVPQ